MNDNAPPHLNPGDLDLRAAMIDAWLERNGGPPGMSADDMRRGLVTLLDRGVARFVCDADGFTLQLHAATVAARAAMSRQPIPARGARGQPVHNEGNHREQDTIS